VVSLSTRARPGGRCGYVERRETSRRCDARRVCGVTPKQGQEGQGRRWLRVARSARSAGSKDGRFTWRWSTATSWRRASSSISLASSLQAMRITSFGQTARGEVYDGPELTTGPSVYLASPGRYPQRVSTRKVPARWGIRYSGRSQGIHAPPRMTAEAVAEQEVRHGRVALSS